MNAYTILVISHTHWDREWYVPFEVLRFGLVRVMDQVIDDLERNTGMSAFLLDGQVILLEDYLHIRPDREHRLRALIQWGRLIIGPWYIQPDEFLVSAESLVRNLLKGLRDGARFGPVMKQGYIPDTFGHISQLPLILTGFGIDTFYFMRGLGADVEALRSEFWWEAPDGSRVLAHYLSQSYSNAAVLGPDPDQMALHHGEVVSYDSYWELRDKLGKVSSGPTLLFMNGGDHLLPQANVGALLQSLNGAVPDEIREGTLEEFSQAVLAAAPDLQVMRGELRFGRHHPVLKDVLSTRLYLKQENATAEALLEGQVERLIALLRVAGDDRLRDFLPYLWAELLRNHPHDSICGCSVDDVHREMMTRFGRVRQLGATIIDDAIRQLALSLVSEVAENEIPIVVFNPSPWVRDGSVRVAVAPYLSLPLGERVYDWERSSREIDLRTFHLVDDEGHAQPIRIVGDELIVADMLHRRKGIRHQLIEFAADAVPATGFRVYRLRPGAAPAASASSPVALAENSGAWTIANEHLRVTAHQDGTLSVTHLQSGREYAGLHVLVDEADSGDEYTFCPVEQGNVVDSRSAEWTVQCNPATRTLTLRGTLMLPARLDDRQKARVGNLEPCPIETTVHLAPRSRRVDMHTTLENRAEDHRLRVAFASGFDQVKQSIAETAYGVISRPTSPEPSVGWREHTSATYAQQRFVMAEADGHGLALLNSGLSEYEVTPDGRILLTLLRAVGWLSRDNLATRRGAAGPELATPDAQCLGRHAYDYAILPYEGRWEDAQLFREAEDFTVPLVARAVQQRQRDPGTLRKVDSLLTLEPPEVVLSALKPAEDSDGVVVRIFNPLDEARTAVLKLGMPVATAECINLNEEVLPANQQVIDVEESTIRIPLLPRQVQSIAVTWPREP